MNTGVEILLKRMESNPDDFVYSPNNGGMSRWMRLVDHAIGEELLTEEEHDAIHAGLKEVKRIRFNQMVMEELAGKGDETSAEGKTPSHIAQRSGINSDGLTQATMDAQRYQTEMMKRHLDAHRQALEDVDSLSEKQKKNMLERILEMKKTGMIK